MDKKITAEEIIKKNIPNGIINIKADGGGNGKPQYQSEISIIKVCMEDYAKEAVKEFMKDLCKHEISHGRSPYTLIDFAKQKGVGI